jgi:V-type H+-transporting ATPase subunit a
MFGDIAHGALVLLFGIYLLNNERRNKAGNKELDVVS